MTASSSSVPPETVCVNCRQRVQSRFEITRFDAYNANKGTVVACGLTCLVQWAYTYATMSGMRIAFGVKNTVSMLLDSIKGGK